MLNSKFQFMSV